jgi:hypothetical protein
MTAAFWPTQQAVSLGIETDKVPQVSLAWCEDPSGSDANGITPPPSAEEKCWNSAERSRVYRRGVGGLQSANRLRDQNTRTRQLLYFILFSPSASGNKAGCVCTCTQVCAFPAFLHLNITGEGIMKIGRDKFDGIMKIRREMNSKSSWNTREFVMNS